MNARLFARRLLKGMGGASARPLAKSSFDHSGVSGDLTGEDAVEDLWALPFEATERSGDGVASRR